MPHNCTPPINSTSTVMVGMPRGNGIHSTSFMNAITRMAITLNKAVAKPVHIMNWSGKVEKPNKPLKPIFSEPKSRL